MKLSKALILVMALLVGCIGKTDPAVKAREQLKRLGIEYSADAFFTRVMEGDALAIKFFLQAGMNPNTEADVVKWYVKRGKASPEEPSILMPVLLGAQIRGHTEIATLLQEAGASKEHANVARIKIARETRRRSREAGDRGDHESLQRAERILKDLDRRLKAEDEKLQKAIDKKMEALKDLK